MSIRQMKMIRTETLSAIALVAVASSGVAAQSSSDWPQWGGGPTRNMAARAGAEIPDTFDPGKFAGNTEQIDMATTENVRWVAKLGSQSYGNPTVSNGRVFVGTNNDSPRDDRFKGDRSTVLCLDEKTGDFIWQLNVPKLGTGKVSDWEYLGICSSPAVEGDRVYLVTNRCEVMCLDFNGMADGNQGFQDEGLYMAWPSETPMEVKATDADIIWKFNMIDELGVFPHNITSCSVLIIGDQIWTSTSNGVDYGHVETPAPNAPTLICLDKKTGELLAEEASGLSQRILHSNWSSPAYLETENRKLVIFGGPDGVLYAFELKPKVDSEGFSILVKAWEHDCNPKEYRVDESGEPRRYATPKGPSEVLSTPIVYGDRVYAVIGQDPEHGEGVGNLTCLDENGQLVWQYKEVNRTVATLSISDDGLLFVADFSGFVHCLDAATGEQHWRYDTAAHIWGSTLIADGRVFVGSEDGFLFVLPATKTLDEDAVGEVDFRTPIYSSPIVANDTLFVATHTHLFAIGAKAGN